MIETTYIEWLFAALAVVLYLYIWLKGTSRIKDKERRKRR